MFTLQTKAAIARAVLTRKRAPYYIQYYVNGVCNLKCKQCNIVETNSSVRELSLPEIASMARNVRAIGGGIVLLTGGEPFLRKDLPEIVRIFKDQQLDVRLQTAGYASSSALAACYEAGARDINVSLDSLVANKQDFINSVPGSWQRAIEAMARISDVFSDDAAICSLGCVLSRFNFREIPAILDFATRIGWWLSLVPVHIAPIDASRGFRSYDGTFCFTPSDHDELRRVLDRVIAMKRGGALLFDAERFIESSYEFLTTGRETWRKNGRCDSPDLYFAVRPNGDFTTCCDYVLERPPNLADPDFPLAYRDGRVHRAAEPYVASCHGCHYGSYPEVSISVRDYRAFFERLKLTLRSERGSMVRLGAADLAAHVERVKAEHPEVYARDTAPAELTSLLDNWSNPQKRRLMILDDNKKRKVEGRVRHGVRERG